MRLIASLLLVGMWCLPCRAVEVTDVDPGDVANWLPVRIEAPAAFDPIAFVRVISVFPDPTDGSLSDVTLPAAPYQFWLKRSANAHPSHATWWQDLNVVLYGSPIGGVNYLQLLREDSVAPELVLRPQPTLYPPGTPPNDRVVLARLWTVDNGTPHDELAVVHLIPEPSSATLALFAAIGLYRKRSA